MNTRVFSLWTAFVQMPHDARICCAAWRVCCVRCNAIISCCVLLGCGTLRCGAVCWIMICLGGEGCPCGVVWMCAEVARCRAVCWHCIACVEACTFHVACLIRTNITAETSTGRCPAGGQRLAPPPPPRFQWRWQSRCLMNGRLAFGRRPQFRPRESGTNFFAPTDERTISEGDTR